MTPKVSVIIPVYNVEKYLRKCLDSIIAQTLEDIEIICVNDGSTDSSLEILLDYAKHDRRIKIISQENAGLGAARNTGIQAATGTYLGFVDSDDFVDKTLYEKAYNKAEKNQADVVIFNIYLYYTDTCHRHIYRNSEFYKALSEEGFFTAIEHPPIIQNIGVWDKIYRRDFIEKHNLLNPVSRIYEDVVFTIQTLVLASRISVIEEPLIYYRKNTGVSIVDKEVKLDYYKFDFLKNFKESKDFLQQVGLYEHFQRDFLLFQFKGVMFHQHNMQTKKTFIEFGRILCSLLEDSDYQILEAIDSDCIHRNLRKYLSHLKRKKISLYYIVTKLKRLYFTDAYYIFFRFPRMKNYFKIKRWGYKWQCEMQMKRELIHEMRILNYEIRKLKKKNKFEDNDDE